jgi:hypothetical protein
LSDPTDGSVRTRSLAPSATLHWCATALQSGDAALQRASLASATKAEAAQIRIKSLSEATGCNILGKAEFMSPGGSVKDRAALFIVRDAEDKGA